VLFAQQAPPPAGSFAVVRADVGTFTAQGGTIGWLVNQDAVVVVDTQYARSAPLCLEGLKERSGGRTIDLVFNTHHHADHTGGNGVFQPVSKKIVAHARVPALMKEFNVQPNAPEPVLPSATFDNTWSEQMGRETVSAKHHGPAHTGADAVLHFERANVVHMGDLLWLDLHPRVDRPAGASIQNWLRTLETVSKAMSHDAVFIAGHARAGLPVAVKGDAIVRQRNYFDAILVARAQRNRRQEVAGRNRGPGGAAWLRRSAGDQRDDQFESGADRRVRRAHGEVELLTDDCLPSSIAIQRANAQWLTRRGSSPHASSAAPWPRSDGRARA
jgi:cyclase